MSYQVLARKYRPKTFAQVVGQQHILMALSNGLKDNRLHHAYLFSGTRGVGKTSIARLFAKGLNCENGVTPEPCGVCENCKAIEEGNFIDLIEIDAASRTKVEDTRELLDNVQYKPAQGRYKVYLIDEVHMLSRHSFNALLKTLEEPPEYVKFLLATTDPQKLPITILSRCMQFHLKALQEQEISTHLQHILQKEHIPFEQTALASIAHSAQGSIRDSLSLTDQAIALGGGVISFQCVKEMLGLIDETQPLAILNALQQANGEQLMQAVNACAEKGVDWYNLLETIAKYLHDIALLQFLPQKNVDKTHPLFFLAQHIAPQDVQFFYKALLQGREELKHMPNQRLACEMVLLRALAFHPKFNGETLPFPQNHPIPAVSPPTTPVSPTTEKPVHKQNVQVNSAHSQALTNLEILQQLADEKKNLNPSSFIKDTPEFTQIVEKITEKSAPKIGAFPPKQAKPTQAEQKQENTETKNITEDYRWEWINPELMQEIPTGTRPSDIRQALAKSITPELRQQVIQQAIARDPWAKCIEDMQLSAWLREMALNCAKVAEDGSRFTLSLAKEKAHLQADYAPQLQQKLSDFYQTPIQLTFVAKEDNHTTPEELYNKIYAERCKQAKHDLAQDPKLAQLIKEFDAELDESSIRPV